MTIHSAVIQKLLSTNAHLGRHIAAQHFKVFTHGSRNGVAVIDSEKTLICLRSACHFLGALARQKAQFMFVATDPLHDEIFAQMTQRIGCRFDNKWGVGGYLTNPLSPKRFRSRRKKINLIPTRPPDCLVIVDAAAKSSIFAEAHRLHIPIVALVDSALPSETYAKITYPVPARDSVPFVYMFCNLITKTILLEQKKSHDQDNDLNLSGSSSSSSPQQRFAASKAEGDDDVLVREDAQFSEKSSDELFVVPYESLPPIPNDPSQVRKLLDRFAVLHLNDCVGEKMGFKGPKSTIEVSNGLTYLDLIINQIESLNVEYGCRVPLLVMNTNKTNDDTVKVFEKYSKANIDIHTFLKNQFSETQSFQGEGSQDGMCQPDHIGALLSLQESGTLDVLLRQGKEYILMVSSDNVAAVIDPKILNRLIQNEIQCCTEVTPITSSDMEDSTINSQARKFKLAEITEFPAKNSKEKCSFIDTRNLWVNLNATKWLVESYAVRRRNYSIPKVNSICQPLSRALQFFDDHVGINVPPSRFLPWETTSDLLLLQSDLYTFAKGKLIRNEARKKPLNPSIVLGSEFEKVSDFQSRFKSIPNIIELDRLEVSGDVWFGSGITLKGVVRFDLIPGTKVVVPDGAVLENKVITCPSNL